MAAEGWDKDRAVLQWLGTMGPRCQDVQTVCAGGSEADRQTMVLSLVYISSHMSANAPEGSTTQCKHLQSRGA